jgi:hypothetical protein
MVRELAFRNLIELTSMLTSEGGFSLGQAAMDHPLCLELCVGAGVMILNVEYRLAPEFPFPTLVDDGYAAVKWVREIVLDVLHADLTRSTD